MIRPAVDGTLAVMKGCRLAKVKRCVITSSTAAIRTDKKDYFTSEDWSDIEKCLPYHKSKTLAEMAAWNYHKNLPIEEKFELVTMCPSLCIGPNLTS